MGSEVGTSTKTSRVLSPRGSTADAVLDVTVTGCRAASASFSSMSAAVWVPFGTEMNAEMRSPEHVVSL